jgi:hypothetical protein
MVTVMCTISIAEHCMVMLASCYPYFVISLIDFVFYDVASFTWLARRLLDSVVFYVFNKKFQKISKEYLS